MLEKAIQGSRLYWGWVIALLVLIGIGFLFYLTQYFEGLKVTGMSRDVSWGFYIAQLTYLVGVAASGVMVVLPFTSMITRRSAGLPFWENSWPFLLWSCAFFLYSWTWASP